MIDGLHTFIERKFAQSVRTRSRHWKRDCSSAAAYEKSVEPNRKRLREVTGLVDPRVPLRLERFGGDDNPDLVAQAERYRVYQVRGPVFEGVWGEGLLLEPKGKPRARVVALPDADQTPEQLVGLAPGFENEAQFARRLAENGFLVVVPVLLDRLTAGRSPTGSPSPTSPTASGSTAGSTARRSTGAGTSSATRCRRSSPPWTDSSSARLKIRSQLNRSWRRTSGWLPRRNSS
jgi:hypothetical protein